MYMLMSYRLVEYGSVKAIAANLRYIHCVRSDVQFSSTLNIGNIN